MRILITNNALVERAGTETYVVDIAQELRRRGHDPVVFSLNLGDVAAYLAETGISVTDDPGHLEEPPDIIHGHHHLETLVALLQFPGVPALNYCHGWSPWQEEPLLFPRVLRYIAVDQPCWERIVAQSGIASDRVRILHNFADTKRFQPRAALPDRPHRALAFGNYFISGSYLEALRSACKGMKISLDVAGNGTSNPVHEPESLLPEYDVVFAKGRAAIEAMATGTAVILCSSDGLGPMVSPKNWDELRQLNFGFRATTEPITVESCTRQLRAYNPAAAERVCDRVRTEATLEGTVDNLLKLYQEVLREASQHRFELNDEMQAAARYMTTWGVHYKRWPCTEERRELLAALRDADRRVREVKTEANRGREAETNEYRRQIAELQAEVHRQKEEHRTDRRFLESERDRWRSDSVALRDSATWRISQGVLKSRPVRALAGRWIDRLGAVLRRYC